MTWLPPRSPNGVIGYRVTAKDVNAGTSGLSVTIEPSQLVTSEKNQSLGLLLRGLTENNTYDVTVRAFNLKNGDRGPVVTMRLVTLVGGKSGIHSYFDHQYSTMR